MPDPHNPSPKAPMGSGSLGSIPFLTEDVLPRDESASADLGRLLSALGAVSGTDFASYKSTTILRRAERRAHLHQLRDLSEYIELLERDAAECSALSEDVLIHVTGFFRDISTFAALEARVFPRLLEQRTPGAPLRIWVVGCSSGEEVYSLAISLLEFLKGNDAEHVPVKLFGTDISAPAIARARSGRYAEGIELDVPPARLASYFSKVGSAYQIRKDVRDLCVFARHDATRDPPFSGMDLVSCRHLLIYLGAALQARLLSVLHYALAKTGFLMLGRSETVQACPGFAAFDSQAQIYRRTSAVARLLFDFASPESGRPASGAPLTSNEMSGALDVHREADRLVLAQFAPPGIVVTEDLAIVQLRGNTEPYLEAGSGASGLDLLHVVREELRLPLRQLIEQAQSRQRRVCKSDVRLTRDLPGRTIEVEVSPFSISGVQQRFFVILFQDRTPEPAAPSAELTMGPPGEGEGQVVAELRRELASARQYMEAAMEQAESAYEALKRANEEVTSANEELSSINDELQMAKHELEARNEELRTLNDEIGARSLEATRLGDDLTNVLSSVEIPILLIGRDLRIRRLAPAAARVFALDAGDVGRPISGIHGLLASAASAMAADVLAHAGPCERTLQDETGHWYQLSGRPYLTSGRRVDGAVLSAFDVDSVQKTALRLREAQTYAEGIVDTLRECLLVFDAERRVRSANRAFHQVFGVNAQGVAGRRLSEVLPAPCFAELDQFLDGHSGSDHYRTRVDYVLPSGEARVFLVSARPIEHTSHTLLALEDVSEEERIEALRRSESELRDVLATAAEGILMASSSGRISFANAAAHQIFGYAPGELLGRSVDVVVPEHLLEQYAAGRAAYMRAPCLRRFGRERPLFGRRKDGTEVELEAALSPQQREDGLLVVAFITDVSERRASDRQIVEYQKKLQQMAFDATLTEESERRRIAADLHDRIGQSLALAQMKLKSMVVGDRDRRPVEEAIELLAHSIIDTRTLIFDLSPPILYDLGLKEALLWLAEDLGTRWAMQIEVSGDSTPDRLNDATAALVFRAVRELLTNVLKHAQVLAAEVKLRLTGELLEIAIMDRGVGFDTDAMARTSMQGGFGLFSVREQLSRLGGTLEIESGRYQGTQVRLRVPVVVEAAPESVAPAFSRPRPAGAEAT